MAQGFHVPKFGNWDNDNVPYTTYFENARRGRVRMNPNDPEENPEAFMLRTEPREPPIQLSTLHHLNPDEPPAEEQSRNYHRRIPSDEQSKKRNSDFSQPSSQSRPIHFHQTRKSRPSDGGGSLSPSASGSAHTRLKSIEAHPSDSTPHRVTSVPKFGAWDETDPRSGEGFTVIFNKVKQEKQIAAAKFPTQSAYSNNQKTHENSSRSKICCCFSGRGSN